MKRKYILFLICSFFLGGVSAQTLEQARTLFTKGDYEKAKPVFKKYAKSQPSNGNYNYWYGVCCLKTGEAEEAVKPLEIAVKKRITGGQLYLGQAYNETYRFEDAVNCFEEYIADLSKRKKPTEEAEKLLEKEGVVTAPGSAFGEQGEGYVRLSYATSMEQINRGMEPESSGLWKVLCKYTGKCLNFTRPPDRYGRVCRRISYLYGCAGQ